MAEVAFACACGQIKGTLADVSPKTGIHAECYCSTCRAGEIYAGAADPSPAAVALYQTSPHLMQITEGADKLGAFSFGPRNLIRWRASCCDSTLFNTPRNPKISFVAIRSDRLADAKPIGQVVASAFKRLPNGKTKHRGLRHLLISAVTRIAGNRFSGRWKRNPLFDTETCKPVADVTVISWAARKALLAQ